MLRAVPANDLEYIPGESMERILPGDNHSVATLKSKRGSVA